MVVLFIICVTINTLFPQECVLQLTPTQDLGNTNYSIAIPRVQFDRRTNAELVAQAVRMLGPQATVNDRNDVVIDGYKINEYLTIH